MKNTFKSRPEGPVNGIKLTRIRVGKSHNVKNRVSAKTNGIFFLLMGFCIGYTVMFWRTIPNLMRKDFFCPNGRSDISVYNYKRPTEKQFILIAVMTTRKYLATRVVDIHATWGSRVPGSVLYFVGGAEAYTGDLPVVTLNNINDAVYPPRLKSFTMLEFISETLADHYEWFLRSDDDMYIRTDELEYFLRRIDSSQAWFIGQHGNGLKHERNQLGLVKPFCMGGVGIIFSRSTLVEVGRHLVPDCLKNTVSKHEDTELGRCVYEFTGLSCTASPKDKLSKKFVQNKERYTNHTLRLSWLENGAITLHPIKVHPHMQRIDSLYSDLKVRQLHHKMTNLRYEISDLDNILKLSKKAVRSNDIHFGAVNDDDNVLKSATKNGVSRFPGLDFGTNNNTKNEVAFSRYSVVKRVVVKDVASKSSPKSAANIGDLKKFIDKEIEYEWELYKNWRVNTQQGDYHEARVFQYMMSYFKSKIVTELEIKYRSKLEFKSLPFAYLRLKSGKTLETIIQRKDTKNQKHLIKTIQKISGVQYTELLPISVPEIWIILPLLGRPREYRRFLEMLISAVNRFGKQVKLMLVLYEDIGGQFRMTQEISNQFRHSSKNLLIMTILTKGTFSRGRAFTKGVENLSMDSLLIFMDVDMAFDEHFLRRTVLNTIKGKQVSFPICFSQYNPIIACYRKQHCSVENNHGSDFGLWRNYGFGIASMFKKDMIRVGGFNLQIQGWGREDLDLYEKCIRNSDLQVFRTVDPSLFHVYHEKTCNREVLKLKYWDCLGSKLTMYGNVNTLAQIALDLKVVKVF